MTKVYEPTTTQYMEFVQVKLTKLVRAIDLQQEAVTELLSALERYCTFLDEQVDKLNG